MLINMETIYLILFASLTLVAAIFLLAAVIAQAITVTVDK